MNALVISETEKRGVWIISPTGRLDPQGGPVLEECCIERIEQGKIRILIDLELVDFVSSAGLRGVLAVVKAIENAGGVLVLCSLSPMVAKVFHYSGFDTFLKIESSPEAALDALSPPTDA